MEIAAALKTTKALTDSETGMGGWATKGGATRWMRQSAAKPGHHREVRVRPNAEFAKFGHDRAEFVLVQLPNAAAAA